MTPLRSGRQRNQNGLPAHRRRVVLVTPGFSASDEDWCIPILRDFAEGLANDNDVSVIALRYPGAAQNYRMGGIDVVSLGGGTSRGFARIGLLARAAAVVSREVRRRSADVIHAFWAHEPGGVACVAGRMTGVPVVVTLMGGELAAIPEIGYGGSLAPANRTLARLSLGLATRVVSLCPANHDAAALRVKPARLRRLDFGVRTDRFLPAADSPLGSPGRPVRFLSVGSLVPVKDPGVLLRAFARCHAELPGTELELVGDGELRESLVRLVGELGITSAVRFVGEVDHATLVECYRRADVMVHSSRWEGGAPQVVQEALACGLPIVGTAVGILPELEGAASCVPVGDVETLGREMMRVAASAETRTRMAAGAEAATRPIDRCIADHETLYDSIRRHRPRSIGRGRDD